MNVNDVVLFGVIISAGVLVLLEYFAHKQQKALMHNLRGSKERLGKLSKLVLEVEKVEGEMQSAAIEKVDRRNLELIIKETSEFLSERSA